MTNCTFCGEELEAWHVECPACGAAPVEYAPKPERLVRPEPAQVEPTLTSLQIALNRIDGMMEANVEAINAVLTATVGTIEVTRAGFTALEARIKALENPRPVVVPLGLLIDVLRHAPDADPLFLTRQQYNELSAACTDGNLLYELQMCDDGEVQNG